MNKKWNLVLATVAVAALAACGKKEAAAPAASAEAVVKIGHVAPTSGAIAHLGKDNENGARMAIDELNAKGLTIDGKKVKFELLAEDDAADPKQGTAAAQKLVDSKVVGVIGHLNSGTTIPASKLYSDAGIPQISPSATNPKYTRQGFKTAFRNVADDVHLGGTLGKYAVTELKGKSIAVIDD
ncbi:MAG: branched-chain amino acid ABC transporter substrate-binding protein, partial [Betaproteobacteria bacterium]